MAQGQGPDLLVQAELVRADHRAVRLGAADELGRPARTVTGAAGALLAVHLLAGARDFVADLDLVRAGPALGQLPGDAALQDVAADLVDAEDGVGEINGAALGAAQRDDVDFHCSSPPVTSGASAGASSAATAAVLMAPGVGRSAGGADLMASRIFT